MILKNKRVLVVGLGKSGFAAAKFLKKRNICVKVTDGSSNPWVLDHAKVLWDLGVPVETGGHTEFFMQGADLVVTSPGVPKKSLPLQWARRRKIPVISEVELASFFCKGAVIAVTGSNGKTTTSHLIHNCLRNAGRKSVLCGNVGYAFLDALAEVDRKTIVVLELSSFQLENCPRFRPRVAVFLNVSANHLDRHQTLRNYIRAKIGIFRNQKSGDFLVANFDDLRVRKAARSAKSRLVYFSKKPLGEGVYLERGRIVVCLNKKKRVLTDQIDFPLKGEHNLENMLAAAAVSFLFKVPAAFVKRTFMAFKTLEHRVEPLGSINGIHFFNDSKSTTVESTRAAILAVPAPVVLIAGGRDKGAPFHEIEPLLLERVKRVVLYGEARKKISGAWSRYRRVEMEEEFKKAVRLAYEKSERGGSILLSPMCTSFDQFASFEQRGEVFKRIFRELKRPHLKE